MDNTKLAALLRQHAPSIAVGGDLLEAADALEAAEAEVQRGLEMWSAEVTRGDLATIRAVQAEAELTRRDKVIAEVKLRLNQAYGYAPEDRIRGALLHIEAFEAGRSAAAPVSLEAVKAETADRRPHSRACGFRKHEHGTDCNPNCQTCHGRSEANRG